MNHEEKKSLTKKWIQVVRGNNLNLLTVINVSSCCVDDVIEHAKLCQQMKADAIAFLPPFYHRPKSAGDLAKYIQLICRSVQDVPVFYYHFPEMTGVHIPPSQWLPLVVDKCPNLVAVKFTDRDMSELGRCIALFKGRVTFYPGYEETMLTASVLGANAFIGALYNLPEAVELNRKIVEAIKQCDMKSAKDEQDKFVKLIDQVVAGPGLIPNLKSKLGKEHQLQVGFARPPIYYK